MHYIDFYRYKTQSITWLLNGLIGIIRHPLSRTSVIFESFLEKLGLLFENVHVIILVITVSQYWPLTVSPQRAREDSDLDMEGHASLPYSSEQFRCAPHC